MTVLPRTLETAPSLPECPGDQACAGQVRRPGKNDHCPISLASRRGLANVRCLANQTMTSRPLAKDTTSSDHLGDGTKPTMSWANLTAHAPRSPRVTRIGTRPPPIAPVRGILQFLSALK